MKALTPRVFFPQQCMILRTSEAVVYMSEMISSLKVPECKPVLYRELLCMLLTTVLNSILCLTGNQCNSLNNGVQ